MEDKAEDSQELPPMIPRQTKPWKLTEIKTYFRWILLLEKGSNFSQLVLMVMRFFVILPEKKTVFC